ncbi:MAG TPA: HAD-IB family phosphatase [Gemmatimonadaceae bacterium]|nr:HAD-IB family phosphatase [Gemmatimonadaceae bacterium]
MTRFRSIVFDVDSTLSGIEGIDWLASQRGADVQAWSASLTERAMNGEIPIEAVYGERMRAVSPDRAEIEELGRIYIDRMANGARELFAELHERGIETVLVSGGLREAIAPLASELGVDLAQVHAVSIYFEADGSYAGFEESSPMTRQNGKRFVVATMGLEAPVLAVGDGMTDSEMRSVVDGFAAFTGFTSRGPVVERADFVIENFDQLRTLILT